MSVINFFHRLLHPHCADCLAQERENKHCTSCETLREQLARVSEENKRLLDSILIKKEEPVLEIPTEPIKPKYVPWRVRQEILEANDRKEAQLIQQKKDELKAALKNSVDELEKEMEIADAKV